MTIPKYSRRHIKGVALAACWASFSAAAVVLGSVHAMADEVASPTTQETAPATAAPKSKEGDLAAAATNPVANLMQLQLQDQYNWSNHNSDGYSNQAVLQPVVPIDLPWDSVPLVITRTTLPYVTTPDLGPGVGRHKGFGDTSFLGLFTPNFGLKGQTIGLGPNFVAPTAGDNDYTGAGKWQAGPAAIYINTQSSTQWGLFAFQNWSFASARSNTETVSKLSLQPILVHHFDAGWYAGLPDNPQVYDFESDKWTLQLGPQVGRVFKIGSQSVKMFGAVYHNPIDDNGPTPEWSAKVGLTFLFPK